MKSIEQYQCDFCKKIYSNPESAQYILEVSDKQAEIMKIALEEYFRLRMNQTWDFADDICFEDLSENHTKEEFNKCIENRDMFRDELEKLLNKVHSLRLGNNKVRKQTEEMLRAQDVWQVLRHVLYLDRGGSINDPVVDVRIPMSRTGEELPVMKRKE